MSAAPLLPSDHYTHLEAQYNARLDAELRTLTDAFADIIDISKIELKDKYTVAHEKLQMESQVANIIRATSNLTLLTKELKQVFLLNDVQTTGNITSLRKHVARHHEAASHTVLDKLREDASALLSLLDKVLI
ncbi:hypothetical protein RI367_006694 [Sorochytrium milnesiophthora]